MATGTGDPDLQALLRELARTPDAPDAGGGGGASAAPLPARPSPTPAVEGAQLLHYRIVGKLGEGGMGSVWRAEDRKLGRGVAIKRIAAHAAADPTARRRLLQEARAASSLSHPNIVTVHAVEEVDGVDFIVMELVEGQTLEALLGAGRLPLERVLALGAEVADALACAHEAGLVHRDIKPANVLVTRRGHAKVLDFGIARASGAAATARTDFAGGPLTTPGSMVGTVPYMAPEQLRGEDVDARADVWALGCLLHEMATGRRAFPARDLASCIHQITALDPPAPSALVPGLPAALDAIVAGALRRERGRRTGSAAEVAAALRELGSRQALQTARARPGAQPPVEGTGEREAEPAAPLLVGREAELGRIEALLAQASAGRGALALVTGEAGIGKTALVEAAVRRARAAGYAVGRGACVGQVGEGEAYLAVVDALGDLVAGPGGDGARPLLLTAAPTWATRVPSLAAAAALPATGGDEPARAASRGRMLLELGDALAAVAARSPLCLVLEDLHWADPSTVDALRHLAPRLERHRAVVLCTARAGEIEAAGHPLRAAFAEWRGRHAVVEIPLAELPAAGVARWLDARFAPNHFHAGLAEALHLRTEGHPLALAAMLEVLTAPGPGGARPRLWRDPAGWHAAPIDEAALAVPASLEGMLRARLDGLDREERALLAAAAVQGAELLAAVLADALGEDEAAIEERLAAIGRRHRLVRRLGDEDLPDGSVSGRFRLAHALYQDLLYQELPAARRVELHRRVAASLLARHRGEEARLAAVVAAHYQQARDPASAVPHLLQAGDNAVAVFATALADGHYARAEQLAGRLPPAERDRLLVDVHQRRAVALQAKGDYAEAAAALERAIARARALGDAALEAGAQVALADLHVVAHRLDQARREAEAALAVAEAHQLGETRTAALMVIAAVQLVLGALDDSHATLDAIADPPSPCKLHLRGLLHFLRSDYDRALGCYRAAFAREHEVGDAMTRMEMRMFHGLSLANRGRLAEALAVLTAAFAQARKSDSGAMRARIGNSLGFVRRELGMPALAEELDRRSVDDGRDAGESEAEAQALCNLAERHLDRGEHQRADEAIARVRELAAADAWSSFRYLLRADCARARQAVARGDADAPGLLAHLLAQAREGGAHKYVATALLLGARLALDRGNLEAARRSLDEARALLVRRPMPLVAWRLEALTAAVARRLGDERAERAAVSGARTLVASLAVGLAPAEREALVAHVSAALGVSAV